MTIEGGLNRKTGGRQGREDTGARRHTAAGQTQVPPGPARPGARFQTQVVHIEENRSPLEKQDHFLIKCDCPGF